MVVVVRKLEFSMVLSPPCGMVTSSIEEKVLCNINVLSPPCGMVTLFGFLVGFAVLASVLSPPCGMVT